MSLLTRISVPVPESPEAEDIFASALTTIFTDDAVNSHGSPGSSITYRSPTFGPLELRVPVHPDEEQGRKLFAHYLWNAGVVAADALEVASLDYGRHTDTPGLPTEDNERVLGEWDKRYWDVRGKHVFEIGAATALPSLVAALCGAASCTITDHPSSPALTAGTIEQNVQRNLYRHELARTSNQSPAQHLNGSQPRSSTVVNVYGYTWGTSTFYMPDSYGKPASPPVPDSFEPQIATTPKGYIRPDKIIIADCLWMPSQHMNIIRTILDFLPETSSKGLSLPSANLSETQPCALVVAGFHTGRTIVRDFFGFATAHESVAQTSATMLGAEERQLTGKLKLASIFETDTSGNRRDWTWDNVREGEGKWEAKRWCVVGVLVRS